MNVPDRVWVVMDRDGFPRTVNDAAVDAKRDEDDLNQFNRSPRFGGPYTTHEYRLHRPGNDAERDAERDALRAEVERLTGCLKRANDQAEHFERLWYLRGDEVESLRAEVERLRTTIKHVAAIAHCGGWVGLREDQALVYVRALTVSSMPGGSLNDATAVLQGAIDAAREAQGDK